MQGKLKSKRQKEAQVDKFELSRSTSYQEYKIEISIHWLN